MFWLFFCDALKSYQIIVYSWKDANKKLLFDVFEVFEKNKSKLKKLLTWVFKGNKKAFDTYYLVALLSFIKFQFSRLHEKLNVSSYLIKERTLINQMNI